MGLPRQRYVTASGGGSPARRDDFDAGSAVVCVVQVAADQLPADNRDRHSAGTGGHVTELVSTARGQFAVQAAGPADGQPVVLVAGLGDDHSSWDPILGYLTPAHQCVTFDNRGI